MRIGRANRKGRNASVSSNPPGVSKLRLGRRGNRDGSRRSSRPPAMRSTLLDPAIPQREFVPGHETMSGETSDPPAHAPVYPRRRFRPGPPENAPPEVAPGVSSDLGDATSGRWIDDLGGHDSVDNGRSRLGVYRHRSRALRHHRGDGYRADIPTGRLAGTRPLRHGRDPGNLAARVDWFQPNREIASAASEESSATQRQEAPS